MDIPLIITSIVLVFSSAALIGSYYYDTEIVLGNTKKGRRGRQLRVLYIIGIVMSCVIGLIYIVLQNSKGC